MSGHSKWANIKRRKAKVDAQKGNLFSKLSREIIVAARLGGPNPDANARLRLAVEKARDANIPADRIRRAIEKGAGGGEGTAFEEATYEGYGPGGVAIMVDVLTDNKNRTLGEIRHLFSKNGGSLGEAGCVSWMFTKKGYLAVERSSTPLDEDRLISLAIEAGAEDFKVEEDTYEIFTAPEEFETVKAFLADRGIKPSVAEITMVPNSTVRVTGKEAEQVLKIMDLLSEHDDVQKVYANFDISEEEMERHAS